VIHALRAGISPAARRHVPALLPGIPAVGLLIVWAAHQGGFFPDTWYWGALVTLALLTVTVVGLRPRLGLIPRALQVALIAFGAYVVWSYLSITWAQYPGAALDGSNRALLYWLLFALFAVIPWTVEAALAALVVFVLAVGTIAVVVMVRLAAGDHVASMFIAGRLASPTGYYNANAALFTIGALVGTALAARRELPVVLRALLLAIACAGLQLALIGQSRGWLFTLPLVALAGIAVSSDRVRVVAAAAIPVLATLAIVHRLLDVFQVSREGQIVGPTFTDATARAGRACLVLCAVVLLTGLLIALADRRLPPVTLSDARRRLLGFSVGALVLIAGGVGVTVATHGRPFHFVAQEWRGFSHPSTGPVPSSNFALIGSGRYDFWRVSLDAVLAHPIGGLGQDNFAEYYIRRRHTLEEPQWTHSLELRLLVHTGIVGFGLMAIFLVAALIAALDARQRAGPLGRAVAGAALLPLAVWTLHGSVDWFWEFPGLSGPALGFLGMATALARPVATTTAAGARQTRLARVGLASAGTLAVVLAALTLGIPYLAVRETAQAGNIFGSDPTGALDDLAQAASMNPLSADADLDAGVLALRVRRYAEAEQRFGQAVARDPGGWEGWLGQGLAASALGERTRARRYLLVSRSINALQPVTAQALADLRSRTLLAPAEALRELAQEL
jgi:hypothetical protein